jgi:hypothetical protein
MAGNKEHHQGEYDVQVPDLKRPGARHEETDINVWAVAKFAIALALVCAAVLALLSGLFRYFLRQSAEEQAAQPSRGLSIKQGQLPPEPRLQATPVLDLRAMRAAEDQVLNSYGWVDQSKGVVRIPIDRAIDLLAQRGLPSRPENGPQSAANRASVPTESGLGPEMIVPGGPLAAQQAQPDQGK